MSMLNLDLLLGHGQTTHVHTLPVGPTCCLALSRNWSVQRGPPAPKTRTALLYRVADLTKPQTWGWDAVTQYADLPAEERNGFLLFESFKKYLMPNDFPGVAFLSQDSIHHVLWCSSPAHLACKSCCVN